MVVPAIVPFVLVPGSAVLAILFAIWLWQRVRVRKPMQRRLLP